ncbi:hypothetical protein HRG_001003 [Hirsutella rhossiliensis]|uniref:Uncharacterized protein n=1 Tax=Hirsutella rhossiliensis TaxID=111463 RepID=A0A9P8SPM2_9HYPO|nr:uncharacterized protein HRG_01003 [Hirsutella rhossiliensis]KAH0968361.1 hypothetical protein HRG_01003 [Hirsutella rhossiliensis]
MSVPSESAAGSLSRGRLLLRRERERKKRFEHQVARGRPDTGWRKCGDGTCSRPSCRYEDMSGTVRDKESNRNGIPTKDMFQRFADEMVGCMWPDECLGGSRGSKHRAVESLATSPPTRFAFWQFRETCRKQQLQPSEKGMKKMLMSLLPGLRRHMPEVESLVHQEADADCREASRERRLHDAAMEFVVDVEVWRRSQDGRFRAWTFGQGGEAAEFLAALLLHLWLMDREDCFEAERGMDGRRCDELWQEWLDERPAVVLEEEAKEEAAEGKEGEMRSYIGGWGEARWLGGGERRD